MFLLSIPLVRDFIALFPETPEFRDRMGRKAFWKAVAGFLICYLVLATVFGLVWFGFICSCLTFVTTEKSLLTLAFSFPRSFVW